MRAVKTIKIEKGFYRGQFKGYGFGIIYNDDLQGDLLWSIHFEDQNFGEMVFSEEDQLWSTKKEAVSMAALFIDRYSNDYITKY